MCASFKSGTHNLTSQSTSGILRKSLRERSPTEEAYGLGPYQWRFKSSRSYWISNYPYARVAQRNEVLDLKSSSRGFESHLGYIPK